MQLSVIIPTYNEVENISSVILAVGKALGGIDYEIIVSDDDSPDLTWACVEEIGKQNLRVRTLRRTGDRALSASVVDGFTQARAQWRLLAFSSWAHLPSWLPPRWLSFPHHTGRFRLEGKSEMIFCITQRNEFGNDLPGSDTWSQ